MLIINFAKISLKVDFPFKLENMTQLIQNEVYKLISRNVFVLSYCAYLPSRNQRFCLTLLCALATGSSIVPCTK